MNNTIIDIPGISLDQRNIWQEHSPDSANLIYIKDEYGNEVVITIVNGQITDTNKTWKK